MASAGRVRLFILPKDRALARLENKQKLVVDDLLNVGVPHNAEYYIYVRLESVPGSLTKQPDGRKYLCCNFSELNVENDAVTGRRGILRLFGPYLTDMAHCISYPASVFLCNFQLASNSSRDANRIELFDIELELDSDHSENGAIYKVEPETTEQPLSVEYVELKAVPEAPKLNVYGIIKSLTVPESGSNIRLLLTDPSLGYERHIACFLATDSHSVFPLPLEAKAGDARKQHGGVMQLFGRMGKAGLSWLLFNGWLGTDLMPRSSSTNYTLKDSDYETASALRKWFASCQRRSAVEREIRPSSVDHVSRVEGIMPKCYGDLLLQVIGVFQGSGSSKPIIVRGWDGTKSSKKAVLVDPDGERLPILSYNRNLSDAVGDFAIDVFVYDNHRDVAQELKSGQYVLMTNVHFGFTRFPEFTFLLHGGDGKGRGRSIQQVNDTSPLVTELLKSIRECISKLPSDKRQPLTSAMESPFRDEARRSRATADTERTPKSTTPVRRVSGGNVTTADRSPSSGRASRSPRIQRKEPPDLSKQVSSYSPPRTRSITAPSTPVQATTSPRTRGVAAAARPVRVASTPSAFIATADQRPSSTSTTFDRTDFINQLRRRPLPQTSGQRSSANIPPSTPPRTIRRDESMESIYSQPSPIPVRRTRQATRVKMVSIAVETEQVTYNKQPSTAARTPRERGVAKRKRDETATTTTVPKKKTYLFDERMARVASASSSSSSSPSAGTRETNVSSSSSDDQDDSIAPKQRRIMRLRTRRVMLTSPSSSSTSSSKKGASPTTSPVQTRAKKTSAKKPNNKRGKRS